jgi:fucose permease
MESMVWNEEIEMKALLSLFALSLIATGLIGLLTLTLTNAAPTLEIRVLAVIGAVLGGYVLMQPLLNRVARRLG